MAELVSTSGAVGATRSRTAKIATLAEFLKRIDDDLELATAVAFLCGEPRQGRIGVGWASLSGVIASSNQVPTLSLGEVDAAITDLASISGSGSVELRAARLDELFARATSDERDFLLRLFGGELRQGALESLVGDAVARAAGVEVALLRRAWMYLGDLSEAAMVARRGTDALGATGLRPGTAGRPMLAAPATSVRQAMTEAHGTIRIEWKLDGARVQAHRIGQTVRLFTRNLNDVTVRLPTIVAAVLGLPVESVVLDGEVLGLAEDDRPERFQNTMSTFSADADGGSLRPFFFDVLHLDGRDLVDAPLHERTRELARIAGPWQVPGLITDDVEAAEAFSAAALAAGHEGVVIKTASSRYEAGRRGSAWRKVKPVRTLDLVVLGAEWGHGRRQGWLSNLHLGARDGDTGEFVMVGKTFKGLTDAVLAWQTTQLLAREVRRSGITVFVRPELVVEIALDGAMVSPRYPGGVSLRFARVKGYRNDKNPSDADTMEAVRDLLSAST